jgi:hypothetical protein
LTVGFTGISAPLSFAMSGDRGQLEDDVALLLNNLVGLFNQAYERYLPGAIPRLLETKDVLQTVNEVLDTFLQPTACIDAERAAAKARGLPRNFSDWSLVLPRTLQEAMENLIDGFMAHNSTGSKHLGAALRIPESQGEYLDVEAEVDINVTAVALQGLSQVRSLRILPHTQAISLDADVTCPSVRAPWRPAAIAEGALSIRGGVNAGAVYVEAPCGRVQIRGDLVLDVQKGLALPAPPPMTLEFAICLLQSFVEINMTDVVMDFLESRGVALEPNHGPAVWVNSEFCRSYPEACSLLGTISNASPEQWNSCIRLVRDYTNSRCKMFGNQESPPVQQGIDTNGFPFVDSSSVTLWMYSLLAVLLLASATVAIAVAVPKAPATTEDGALLPRCSLAQVCRTPRATWAAVGMSAISLVLAVGLVLKVLAVFVLLVVCVKATASIDSLGGGFADITYPQFTYLGFSAQLENASMTLINLAWIGASVIIPFVIFGLQLALWLTPAFIRHRCFISHATIFIGRLSFQQLLSVLNTAACLASVLDLPAGVKVPYGLGVEFGHTADVASAFCMVLVSLSFCRLLRAEAAQPARPSSFKVALKGDAAAGAVAVGTVVWLFAGYLHIEFAEAAGTLRPVSQLSGVGLISCLDPLQAFPLIMTTVLAPFAQVVGHLLSRVKLLPSSANILRDFGHGFAFLDLFAVGIFILACPIGIGRFVPYTFQQTMLPLVCELFDVLTGKECVVLNLTPMPWGPAGMMLSGAGSVALFYMNAVADVQAVGSPRSREDPSGREPSPQSSQPRPADASLQVATRADSNGVATLAQVAYSVDVRSISSFASVDQPPHLCNSELAVLSRSACEDAARSESGCAPFQTGGASVQAAGASSQRAS